MFIYKKQKKERKNGGKTMYRSNKKALALALALVMSLALGTSAFANSFEDGILTGTPDDPAQASINKTLKMPIGTNTPASNFIFEVKSISIDGAAATATNMPIIGTPIGVTAPTTGTVAIPFLATDNGSTAGDVKTVILESANLFTLQNVPFPSAGTYVFEITERANTNAAIDLGTNINESLTYSDGKYTMTVIVMNKEGGGLYIGTIETVVTEVDNLDQEEGAKIDPTPEELRDDTYASENSEMVFTNTYIKHNGNDHDPLTGSVLAVKKIVAGELGNKTTAYFRFDVEVRNNSLVTTPTAYNAYIVENGAIVSADHMADPAKNNVTPNGEDDNEEPYITFAVGTPRTVYLKHGQSLVFVDTPVGTHYDVEEKSPTGYVPSFIVKSNNVQTDTGSASIGQDLAADDNLVGELLNEAAFTNTRNYTAPTGLSISDLPFAGLILLSIGALALFAVAAKKRSKRKLHN